MAASTTNKATTNNPQNVTLAKTTKVGGYAWWAPKGTTLPTDVSTTLPNAYVLLGYISEDGITNSPETETTEVKEMGGSTVLEVITGYKETYQFKLIEFLRKAAAQVRYGPDNVTGTDGEMTITHTMPDAEEFILVFEIALTGGRKSRMVIPAATRAELGEDQRSGSDAIGYDVTVAANPSEQIDGGTSREYIGTVTTASNGS